MSKYIKPVVSVDAGMAEGVYAASGASKGNLTCDLLWCLGQMGNQWR